MWHVWSSECETNITAPPLESGPDDKWRCSRTRCLLSRFSPTLSFIHERLCWRWYCYSDFVCLLEGAVNCIEIGQKEINAQGFCFPSLVCWSDGLKSNEVESQQVGKRLQWCELLLCLQSGLLSSIDWPKIPTVHQHIYSLLWKDRNMNKYVVKMI